jgi:phosphatidylglycerol:prolipoprotein diacylglycerol transferase
LHPEIFHFGPLHLRSYGLMLSLSFLLGLWLALREARSRGYDPDAIVDLGVVLLASGVAGARLLYVVSHLNEFAGHWIEVLFVWQGGLTLWGGFLVAVPAGILFCRRRRLPTWEVADVFAGPVAVGAAVGRFGCFLNGCCYGLPTHLPWAIRFPAGSLPYAQFGDGALHPSQLYNVLAGLATYVVVAVAGPRLRASGQRWWLMLGTYGLLRAVVDLSRYYEPSAILARWGAVGLTESQVTGVVLALLSLAMFLALGRQARAAEATAS